MKIKKLKIAVVFFLVQTAILIAGGNEAIAQTTVTRETPKVRLSNQSIVKDSSGQVLSLDIWQRLFATGRFTVKPEDPGNEKSAFILVQLSEEERIKRLSNSPKPQETKNFTTGKEVNSFSNSDMNGKKIKLKDLKGKVVVLNFWFINCPPCRAEIPELNNLVEEYKDSANIVFLAIALDDQDALKDFFKRQPFDYTIIDNGRSVAQQYGITAYPTHVVIDQEGKAYFHTAGGGPSITYWLKKSISDLMAIKKPEEKKEN